MDIAIFLQGNAFKRDSHGRINSVFLGHQQQGADLRNRLPGIVNVANKQRVRDLMHGALSIGSILKGSRESLFHPVAVYLDGSLYWRSSTRSSAHAPPHRPGS